jgi:hypothetical protein
MGAMEAEPFTPDDVYCVYCHAPAAGTCAECGALCCGDCVEVVLRLTTPRAICKSCLAAEPERRTPRVWRWVAGAAAIAAGVVAMLYWMD